MYFVSYFGDTVCKQDYCSNEPQEKERNVIINVDVLTTERWRGGKIVVTAGSSLPTPLPADSTKTLYFKTQETLIKELLQFFEAYLLTTINYDLKDV